MTREQIIDYMAMPIVKPLSKVDTMTTSINRLKNRLDDCICIAIGKREFKLTINETFKVIASKELKGTFFECEISEDGFNKMVGIAKAIRTKNSI